MLLSAVLMMALAVGSSSAWPNRRGQNISSTLQAPPPKSSPPLTLYGSDRMAELLDATVNYLHAVWSSKEYIRVPNVETTANEPIMGGLIEADMLLYDDVVFGYGDFEVVSSRTDPTLLKGQISMRWPQNTYVGYYHINGEAFGAEVRGEGNYGVRIINSVWSMKNIIMYETPYGALRIESLGVDVEIDKISFAVQGLVIENGMDLGEYELRASRYMKEYFESIKHRYDHQFEANAIRNLNNLIGDKTLEQVVQWLRAHTGEGAENNLFASLFQNKMI